MGFRNDFVWGAATAAYQIEGAWDADGKGPSVWDHFCRQAGAIKAGDHGETACDHYHLYRQDVALMAELGLRAYRFSISWPRVIPEGVGTVNRPGLDFYDRLVDELLQKGITPYATLFHWEYPLALHRRGGWLHPDSPAWFADYTRVVVERLSDRVRHWFTLNENKIFVLLGYYQGIHAPGNRLTLGDALQINHRVLLAHGRATQVIRQTTKQPCQVGMAFAVAPKIPATSEAADIEAARLGTFIPRDINPDAEGLWADPAYLGSYPEELYRLFGADMPSVGAEDWRTIAQPLDFIGLNIYVGEKVQAGSDGAPTPVALPAGCPRTAFDWPVVPEALYWGPRFYYERYRRPVLISENGLSNPDWVGSDGRVHDPQRIDFTRRYLCELKKAVADGVDVGGYFHWSLMDNFEWAEGYRQRFGLAYVDFATQRRTIKDSGYWYRDVIRSNGEEL
ncbi:MAG: GH1 family beta-glucosidase [Bacillota bacterium]|jgi:beta-glucosidase